MGLGTLENVLPRVRTVSLQRACVLGRSTPHRGAAVGTKREGHEGLAGRRIVRGTRTRAQGRSESRRNSR